MAFIRAKKRGNREYYYLVENYREGDKVKQRVIRYLGKNKPSESQVAQILSEVRKGGQK